MPEDKSRRRFLVSAGTATAAALAGCGGGSPEEEDTDTSANGDGGDGGSDGGDSTDMDDSTATDTATDEPTDTPTPTEQNQYTGGTVTIPSIGAVQTLDPTNAKGSGAGFNQYAEPLMTFRNGDLPAVGRLAKDFSVSDDGKTYTFNLQQGVKFHDGSEMTASDVAYSFRRVAGSPKSRNKDDIIGGTFVIDHEKESPEGEDATLDDYVPGSLAVEAVDKYTFQFTTREPFHGSIPQIAGGTFAILPEGAVGDIQGYDGEYDYNVFFSTKGDGPKFNATGPFKIESWSKGAGIRLSAFEDYYFEGPFIDEIFFKVYSGDDGVYRAGINKDLDVFTVPTGKFDPDKVNLQNDFGSYQVGEYGPLPNGETVKYGRSTDLNTTYIVFNVERTERPFRRAIAWLLNPHEIAEDVFNGVPEPAYHITPSTVFPAREGETPSENYDKHAKNGFRSKTDFGADGYPYGYNDSSIEEAKQIMEDAGYSEDEPFEATFTVFKGDTAWDTISQDLRDKAGAAHIDLNIQKAGFGTIIGDAIGGNMDMFSLGDGMEWPESDNFLRFLNAHNPSNQFTRWGGETSDERNQFMEQAYQAWEENYVPNKGAGAENQQKRDQAYLTLEETNWASVQELPLIHSVNERWWYPHVDLRMHGTMENQTFNKMTLENQ